MNEPDKLTCKRDPMRGVLADVQDTERFDVARWEPPDDLRPWISHLWRVRWSLPPGEIYVAHTLPLPVVHVVFEADGGANVVGPIPMRFERRLEGSHGVLGVHVRPAVFRLLSPVPLGDLRDRRVDAGELLGPEVLDVARRLPALAEPERHRAVCAWLRAALPPIPADLAALRDAVEHCLEGHIGTVPELAAAVGLSERTLQRHCQNAIGWTPRQIVQRHRIHEALARLDAGACHIATLALDLGYSDQAHFCREFKGLTGVTPREYSVTRRGHESPKRTAQSSSSAMVSPTPFVRSEQ